MSLACLVCHSIESPSHSFRSYSVSSSDNEGQCSAIAKCLTRKISLPNPRPNPHITSSQVMPQPGSSSGGVTGAPRLVRSRAVRRDIVRDWDFNEELGNESSSVEDSSNVFPNRDVLFSSLADTHNGKTNLSTDKTANGSRTQEDGASYQRLVPFVLRE